MGRRIPQSTIDAALKDLQHLSWDQVADRHGISRGAIYHHALKAGARKTELRITERRRARKQRQADFLAQVMNTTTRSDVLDYLDGLPDEAAAMILTSPPYNVDKKYGGAGRDCVSYYYYLGWLIQVLSECSRVLSPGGVLFLQVGNTRDAQGRLYPIDVMVLDHLLGMGLSLQNRVIWTVPHGLTPKRRLANRYETALVLSKGDPNCFYPTSARSSQQDPGKRGYKGPKLGQLTGHPLGAAPTDVWTIPHLGAGHREKRAGGGHPCQFPEALAMRAIHLWSQPGDLIVDPFVGSGSSAVAAKRSGRAFTGADLFYEDARRARLEAAGLDPVCILPGVTDESLAVWQAEARAVTRPAAPVSTRDLKAQMDLYLIGND